MALLILRNFVPIFGMNLCSIFLLVFLLSPYSVSQDITGNIEGRIVDSTGTSLVGVNVSLQSKSLQGSRGTTTNEKGYFRILYLPVGDYTISASAVGFSLLNIENIQVLLGKTTNLRQYCP